MNRVCRLFCCVALLLGLLGRETCFAQDDEDWSKSPEAYFLVSEERREWNTLDSRESRRDFIDRYWLKRDPTSGTARNEFRELVAGRIKTADERYRIETKAGSRTAQGLVFIVFGTPARVQKQRAPLSRGTAAVGSRRPGDPLRFRGRYRNSSDVALRPGKDPARSRGDRDAIPGDQHSR